MPELRKDPITGRWVVVSTERQKRPNDFILHKATVIGREHCPFCPGHEAMTPPEVLAYRAHDSGANGRGWDLRVVPNRFPALRVEGTLDREGEGMFDRMSGIGAHEVVIEHPDHDKTFATMTEAEIARVLSAFRDRVHDLKNDFRFRYILLFKNHGEAAGATLEHPHCQLIALPVIPECVREEVDGALLFYELKERCIYCDILRQEAAAGVRMVMETDRFVVLNPYAPRFPFETWILPKRHESHFEEADAPTLQNLAWVLRSAMRKIDKVLDRPAYNFIIHSGPPQEGRMAHYHWHVEIIPKLTKVAGFEWGTGFYVNPTPPEESAKFLRDAGLG